MRVEVHPSETFSSTPPHWWPSSRWFPPTNPYITSPHDSWYRVNAMLQLSLSETASKKLKELIVRDGAGEIGDTFLRGYVIGVGGSSFRDRLALVRKGL